VAGVESGDKILSVDGKPVSTEASWDAMLAAHKPGDAVPIVWQQRGTRREGSLKLSSSPFLTIETYEAANLPMTDAQKAFRVSWLGTKVEQQGSGQAAGRAY